MKVYGLTGGIGMGKSMSDKLLRERGVPVMDTDTVARDVVAPGQPALEEIREAFGDSIIGEDGCLKRGELARRVFGDEAQLKLLESIVHPRIRAVWKAQLAQWRSEGRKRAVVVIPLLFETAAQDEFDFIICVACSKASQRERLHSRGWSDEQIDARSRAQWPVERKMEFSNYVVWTEGDVEVHADQLKYIIS